jgi:hypothetical protein
VLFAVSYPAVPKEFSVSEKILECEVKEWRSTDDGRKWGWKLTSVSYAKSVGTRLLRCKDCHGKLKLVGTGKPGGKAVYAVHTNPEDKEHCPACAEFNTAKDGRRSGISGAPMD